MKTTKRLKKIKEYFPTKPVTIEEGLGIIAKHSELNFAPSITVSFVLNIDPTKADQLVKGEIVFPYSTGVTKRVLLLVADENIDKFKNLNCHLVGGTEIINKIKNEKFVDFDVTLASKDITKELKSLAKILGPRGLMPTPKNNTLVENDDIPATLEEIHKGKHQFKNNKQGHVICVIGKSDLKIDEMVANFNTLLAAIKKTKVKGTLIKKCILNATMCPGIELILPA